MYYSIPGVREATLSLKEVDLSKASESAHNVSRKTRVSFESHTTVLLDGLFDDEFDGLEDSDVSLGELDDLLMKLFFNTQ